MILEKLGSLTLLALAKKAGLLAMAAPALAIEASPPPALAAEPEPHATALADIDADDDDMLSVSERSEIVTAHHGEAIASLDLASADLAELKSVLAGLDERTRSLA